MHVLFIIDYYLYITGKNNLEGRDLFENELPAQEYFEVIDSFRSMT